MLLGLIREEGKDECGFLGLFAISRFRCLLTAPSTMLTHPAGLACQSSDISPQSLRLRSSIDIHRLRVHSSRGDSDQRLSVDTSGNVR